MTFKKLKPGKIAIVVFLTALIWVWADLAQDERFTLTDVRVEMAKSSNPALWVSFVGERSELDSQTAVTLDSVVLKGPAARVAKVKSLKNKGKLGLDLFLTPEQEAAPKTGVHPLDVLEFLKRSPEFRQLGLTVESCEPRQLMLRTQELVEESVPVECTGLEASVQVKSIRPETVKAYVPKEEAGIRKAIVRLTSDEQTRAKTAEVEKTPYIELAPGQRRDILGTVKVTLAPAQNVLSQWRVPAAVGLCFNQNMQGKYRVVLLNDPTELANVMILATPAAQQAYAGSLYQLILYIQDSDRQATEQWIQRPLVFNFEAVQQRDEIKPDQPPPIARFTLQPVGEANVETGP
jgi:hypothetical protein